MLNIAVCMGTLRRTLAVSAVLVILCARSTNLARAQEPEVVYYEEKEEYATVVSKLGNAVILLHDGPELRGTGSHDEGHAEPLRLQWYFVQDSSLGIVFDEPVGIKISDQGNFDADIDFVALKHIRAFEVKILTFNMWREFTGTLRDYSFREILPGQTGSFDPRWRSIRGSVLEVCITYISRVRYIDDSIRVADPTAVFELAKTIDDTVSYDQLEEEPTDIRELLEQLLEQT